MSERRDKRISFCINSVVAVGSCYFRDKKKPVSRACHSPTSLWTLWRFLNKIYTVVFMHSCFFSTLLFYKYKPNYQQAEAQRVRVQGGWYVTQNIRHLITSANIYQKSLKMFTKHHQILVQTGLCNFLNKPTHITIS